MRWKLPASVARISIENNQFEAGPLQALTRTGTETIHGVDVPDHLDPHMKMRNYELVARPADAKADEPKAPAGPTAEEVALAQAKAATKAKAKEIKRMTSDDLMAWLVNHGVNTSDLTDKPKRLAAAFAYIGYSEDAEK